MLFDLKKLVGDLLQGVSRVSYMLLILFRAHEKGVMSHQLYHDKHATVWAAFHLVARTNAQCSAQPLLLWHFCTDSFKRLFGVVRKITHGENRDAKELGDRQGAAVSLVETWSKHPDWCRISRRLHEGTQGQMNDRKWEHKGRQANCSGPSVDCASCWKKGVKRCGIHPFLPLGFRGHHGPNFICLGA